MRVRSSGLASFSAARALALLGRSHGRPPWIRRWCSHAPAPWPTLLIADAERELGALIVATITNTYTIVDTLIVAVITMLIDALIAAFTATIKACWGAPTDDQQ